MKKIAIIGANSYIARNLIFILSQKPDQFQLALYDYTDSHIDDSEGYTKIDILSKDSVKNIDFNCDALLIFVGKTGTANGFDNYEAFIDINEKSLLNILNEYVQQNSEAKIIFPSTRLVYKGSKDKIQENSVKEFKTIYAINKYACEQYLNMYSRTFGIQYCIFRISIPYGTLIPNASSYGTAEFMLNKAINGENIILYGDGNTRRTLTYMGDLCDILITGALSDKFINDIYNIGGEDYSLSEMAELIAKKYNVEVDYVPWPKMAEAVESGNTVFDSEKLDAYYNNYKMKFKDWVSL